MSELAGLLKVILDIPGSGITVGFLIGFYACFHMVVKPMAKQLAIYSAMAQSALGHYASDGKELEESASRRRPSFNDGGA